jgi:hypothetical protein
MSRVVNLANFQQFTAINLLTDPGMIGGPKIIPQCVEVTIDWQLTNGRVAHNVLHGSFSGAYAATVATAQAMYANLVTTFTGSTLVAEIASTTSLTGITLRNISSPNQPLVASTGAATPGTGTGNALPDEVALVGTLRTAFTGRAARGRLYQPGWAPTANGVGGVAAASAVAAFTGYLNNLPAMFTTGNFVWVLGLPARNAYVGSTGTQHPARAATTLPITSTVVRDNHWDSQRRRGLK